MKEAKFKELVSLSKGFKIFLCVLSVVAVAAFCFAFAVKEQSQDKIYIAQMTLNSQRLVLSTDIKEEFSYNARLHFPHLAFLLRSKTLSSVEITKFSWNEKVDLSLINNLRNEGRGVFFTSTQNLQSANINDLGSVQYRVDFAPFFQTILCYYLLIAFVATLLYFVLAFYMKKQLSVGNVAGGGGANFSNQPHSYDFTLCLPLSVFICT